MSEARVFKGEWVSSRLQKLMVLPRPTLELSLGLVLYIRSLASSYDLVLRLAVANPFYRHSHGGSESLSIMSLS